MAEPVRKPPPVPPPFDLATYNSTVFNRNRELANEVRKKLVENSKIHTPVTPRITPRKQREELVYLQEMFDTINGKKVLLPRRSPSNKGPMISRQSTATEVRNWLVNKQFSDNVVSIFSKFNGEELFLIGPETIERTAGDEAKRLISMITVQKKRSNFNSYNARKDPALNAILEMRKHHIDAVENDIIIENEPPLAESLFQNPNDVVQPEVKQQRTKSVSPYTSPILPRKVVPAPVLPSKVVAPIPAKRTTAPAYNPTRLYTPAPAAVNNDYWIQTVKSYH